MTIGAPVYMIPKKRIRTYNKDRIFCCEYNAKADAEYQVKQARKAVLKLKVIKRVEEAELVIDNGHSNAEPDTITI